MQSKTLAYYIDAFSKMNRAVMRGKKAPHKPILLLAVINLIEKGAITCNCITLSNELIKEFRRLWSLLVDNNEDVNFMVAEGLMVELVNKYPFNCKIENPYYHMGSEPFWTLEKSDGFTERKSYTGIGTLRKCFKYAVIDSELFELMMNPESNVIIKNSLNDLI